MFYADVKLGPDFIVILLVQVPSLAILSCLVLLGRH
jgi:hypothetical protein